MIFYLSSCFPWCYEELRRPFVPLNATKGCIGRKCLLKIDCYQRFPIYLADTRPDLVDLKTFHCTATMSSRCKMQEFIDSPIFLWIRLAQTRVLWESRSSIREAKAASDYLKLLQKHEMLSRIMFSSLLRYPNGPFEIWRYIKIIRSFSINDFGPFTCWGLSSLSPNWIRFSLLWVRVPSSKLALLRKLFAKNIPSWGDEHELACIRWSEERPQKRQRKRESSSFLGRCEFDTLLKGEISLETIDIGGYSSINSAVSLTTSIWFSCL